MAVFLTAGETYSQVDRPRPTWVDKRPYIPSRIEGVGVASEYASPDSNIILARQRALGDLATFLQVSITSSFYDTTIYKRVDKLESLQQTTRQNLESKVNTKLHNVKDGGYWHDKKNNVYYAYAYIEWDDFIKEMEVYKNVVIDYLRNGESAEENGEIEKALREYSNGLNETLGIHPFFFEAEINGRKEYLPSLMKRKVENCLSKFEVQFISGNYSGEYGAPLGYPLTIKVAYGIGENRQYFPNIPVTIEFQKGQGILKVNNIESKQSISGKTDQNGEIKCEISKILSVTKQNIITATVDFQSIFGDNWEDYKKRFQNQLTIRHVYSSYFVPTTKSSITISIDGSSDEQVFAEGAQAEITIGVNDVCRINLFNIKASGEITCELDVTTNNRIIEHVGDRWIFRFKTTFFTDAGEGVETIICITTPADETSIFTENRIYSKDEIIQMLNTQLDRDEYQINTLSYVIKK